MNLNEPRLCYIFYALGYARENASQSVRILKRMHLMCTALNYDHLWIAVFRTCLLLTSFQIMFVVEKDIYESHRKYKLITSYFMGWWPPCYRSLYWYKDLSALQLQKHTRSEFMAQLQVFALSTMITGKFGSMQRQFSSFHQDGDFVPNRLHHERSRVKPLGVKLPMFSQWEPVTWTEL